MASASLRFAALLFGSAVLLAAQEVGNAVCAQCHAEIARAYAKTPMANSSGRVGSGSFREDLSKGAFSDPGTLAQFQVALGEGAFTLQFDRDITDLHGKRELKWHVGSGRIGRSYLFSDESGFIFQSPVSYYTSDGAWRASPGFEKRNSIELTRAVEPACLNCHASRLSYVPGTQNRYGSKPFLQDGISCEKCHGAGARHVAVMKAGRKVREKGIVNPARLAAEQRDSVCAQCHLTGAARVARLGGGRSAWAPGEPLSNHVAVYVWAEARNSGLAVTSHFEKLSYSKCKQASGDALWCGSCHPAHTTSADVITQIRQKCVGCHTAPKKTCSSASTNNQCEACHMPKREVRDAEHAVYTDHSIPRKPVAATNGDKGDLIPFWTKTNDSRDLALAYAAAAMTESALRGKAFELLQQEERKNPRDYAIASQLAQFLDRMNRPDEALPLFERVVNGDPDNTAALINLGSLYAQKNRLNEAIALWQKALTKNPGLTQARVNLAVAQFRSGDKTGAVESLKIALRYDPDSQSAIQVFRRITGGR